jgi:hypothetical protein
MDISVTGFETISEVTHFEIKVIKESGQQFTFLSRFSELYDVHIQFKEENKKKTIPEFPPKKLFGSSSIKFIEQRLKGLELYFANIMKYKDKLQYNLNAWVQFINKRELADRNTKTTGGPTLNGLTSGRGSTDQRLDTKPGQSSTGSNKEVPYQNKIESLYEEYRNKLVFMDTKYLNANVCKKNNTQVDAPALSVGVTILADDSPEFGKLTDAINAAELLSSEIDNLIHVSHEAEKKKYGQEFFHTIKMNLG